MTKNVSEKSINNILDYVGGEGKHASRAPQVSLETLEAFYNATMAALEEAKNDRLSVKCNLKLAKLWLERKEYGRLRQVGRSFFRERLQKLTPSVKDAQDVT